MLILSVKDDTGKEVHIKAGGHAERELVLDVMERLKELGVGWFKSEAKVLASVDKAIHESFYALKSDVLPLR